MDSTNHLASKAYSTIPEAKARGKFGTTRLYKLLNAGKLRAVKAGTRTLIENASIDEYLASLPAYERSAA